MTGMHEVFSGTAGLVRQKERVMKSLFKLFVLVTSLAALGSWGGNATAATITSTAAGGNWGTTTTWVGGVVPAAGDTVIIATTGGAFVQIAATITQTGPVTVNTGAILEATRAGVTVVIGPLTVNSGGTVTLKRPFTVNGATNVTGTINFGSTSTRVRAMTFNGAVTLNSGAVWDESNGGTNTVLDTFTFAGSLTNNATTFTTLAGLHTFSAAGTLSGATVTAIPNVTFTAAYTNSGTLSVSTALTVTGITLTNNVTITATAALSGTGQVTQGTTGTLNLGGTTTITTLTATAAGNTVNYNGAAQTAKVTTYSNLTLSGSGAKTFATTPTVNGVLSMQGTATVTVTTGVVTYGANATLQYNTATARTVSAEEWISPFAATGGIIIANTGVITVGAAKTLSASAPLTINSGATLATGTFQITVNGNVTNNGTQTATTGSITLSGGAAAHTLSGNGVYANLILNDTLGATLTGSPRVSGVLTLTSGIITTGANTLGVTSSCAAGITGAGATSYVLGNLTLNYPAGTITCTFPVGVTGSYTPVALTMVGVTSSLANSSLTARTDTPDYPATTAGAAGINASSDVNLYWTLTPGGSLVFASYNPTFNFNAGNLDGGATTGTFIIGQYNGSAWSYPTISAANATSTATTGITQATGFGVFVIGNRISPSLTVLKTVAVYFDPVNGTTNPKFIPGAVAQYTIITTNSGGPADNNTAVITDPIPTNTALYVNDIGSVGSGPVLFTQGASSSTLSYTFTSLGSLADNLDFSNNGGTSWTYTPTAGANGCDPAVTNIRVKPQGTFYGSAVTPNPSFQLTFRVCVN